MRKIKTESTEAQTSSAGFKGNRTPLVLMCVIVFLAAFVRVAFSVSTSYGSDFALSGGSVSTNNLYILSELVGNGAFVLIDGSLFYPYGTVNTAPFLFALVMYPFAALVNVFVSDATLASSIVLAFSGPVFAVAAVIASYFLGKRILKSRLAGYLTALFVALCPIFVKESVFSNGTGTSFILFLLILSVYFLYKAVESVDYKEGGEATRKNAYLSALVSGIILALVAITWVDYRAILLPVLAVMVVQVLVDRFKGKDPMPMALVYSITVLIAAVGAGVYYGVLGLWEQVASGSVFLAVFISALVAGFAATSKKPWTLTLPIFIVLAAAVLIALFFLMPDFFGAIVQGNPLYDEAYLATLGEQKLTLSMLSTYYGAITYWFVYLVVLGMLYKFRANAGSAPYVFTMVWLFVLTLTCGHNATEAAIATPVFALGFAGLVCWILKHVDFKAYFSAIRTASGKGKVRRVFRPAPFVSIVLALLLVVGPNVTYVLDASISSNDVDDYNESVSSIIDKEPFGALSYYIKTDDSWKVRDALKDIRSDSNNGALISWMDYSADAPLYGGLNSYTDTDGHGTVTASNILLANAINGASSAAILVNAINYAGGVTDSVRQALLDAGISDADINIIVGVLKDAEYKVGGKNVRYMVTTDVETYGKVTEDISDDNVKYLFLTNFLAENYPQYVINQAYDNIAILEDLATPYIMVTGDMMPFYYGYAGVFNEMARLNGYDIDETNYTVNKFTQFGYYAYYYGIYGFTDAMYDTLLYRTYMGMSPAEAGFNSIYDYMIALSNADSSVVMQPGYGLSNYSVAYWQVMYNANDDADADSDGWKQMDGKAAIAKQKVEGGRINYLSGLPVILAYESNSTGTKVTGNVVGAGAMEVRISAVDKDGNLGATTFTDENGDYTLYVKDPANTTLVFYAGSQGVTGGVIFETADATAVPSVTLPTATVKLYVRYVFDDGPISLNELSYTIQLTNSVTKEVFDYTGQMSIPFGTYDVSVKDGDASIYSGSIVIARDTSSVNIDLDAYEVKLKFKDAFGKGLDNVTAIVQGDHVTGLDVKQIHDGEVTFYLPKGDYTVSVASSVESYYVESPKFSVSSSTTKPFDVVKGKTVTLPNTIPAGTVVTFVNDVYRISTIAGPDAYVTLPVSEFGTTAYTAYYANGSKINYDFVSDIETTPFSFEEKDSKKISGTLKNAAGTPVSGTVTFYTIDGAMFRTSVGSDGAFTLYDVPSVEMMVYATNGTSEAYFGNVAADATTSDINMTGADLINPSGLKWSGVYAEYLNVVVKYIDGLAGYTMYLNVNSSGSYKILVPKTLNLTIDVTLAGNMFFKVTDNESKGSMVTTLTESVRTVSSYTLCARASPGTSDGDGKDQMIKLDNDLGLADEYYLSIGSVNTVKNAVDDGFTATASISYTLGKNATESAASGIYYANGTFAYDPFVDGFTIKLSKLLGYASSTDALEAITYKPVFIDGLDTSDVVTVKGDYKAGNTGASDGREYLFKESALADKPLVTIKNADGTQIQYCSIDDLTPSVITKDLEEVVTIRGYVGIDADGTVTVEYGSNTVEFDVDNGAYELKLYKDVAADVNVSVSKDGAKYISGTIAPYTPTEGGIRNFIVSGKGSVTPIDATDVLVEGTGVYKKVTVTVDANAFINNDKSSYFKIKLGDAWESAYAYDDVNDKVISKIYVEKDKGNSEFTIVGYYNSSLYDLTSEEMLITLDGTAYDQRIYLNGGYSKGNVVYVNKLDDVVNDHAYTYVIEVNNLTGVTQAVKLSYWIASVDTDKWNIMVEEYAMGTTISTKNIVSNVPEDLNAFPGVTTFKVSFIPVSDDKNVPALNLETDFVATGLTIVTLTSDSVTIDNTNGKVTINAEPGSAEVSATDMNASGRGVLNELSDMPTIVWAIFALAIILAILTIWMASKRGVFARRK